VEGDLEESISLLNHVSIFNMHKMGFTKVGNSWLMENEVATNIRVGANDHGAGPSGENQDEEDTSNLQPLAIEIYHPLDDTGLTYSQFERMVLNQLQELNVSQNAHHAYYTTRFQDFDD